MPQVYFRLDDEDLDAVDFIAERDFDGNRSDVLRAAVAEYLAPRRSELEAARHG